MEQNSNYLIDLFWKLRKSYRFTAIEHALFYELLVISKKEAIPVVQCSNIILSDRLNISEKSLRTARINLVKAGLIIYTSGYTKRSIGKYSFPSEATVENTTNVTVKSTTHLVPPDAELKENEPPKKRASKPFIPPTLEEVTKYCLERKNGIDPQHFIDHYQAKGWMIGKNKMKDWKAAVRTWEQSKKQNENKSNNSKPKDYSKGF